MPPKLDSRRRTRSFGFTMANMAEVWRLAPPQSRIKRQLEMDLKPLAGVRVTNDLSV